MDKNTKFSFRCLRDEAELIPWSTLCEAAFAEKARPEPAAFFLKHFYNDPTASLNHIFVATPEDDDSFFISSVRIFHRPVFGSVPNDPTMTAGVGEVCTLTAFRRKGLAEGLLRFAIDRMRENNYESSLLHAAEHVRPLYTKLGYVSSRISWLRVRLVDDENPSSMSGSSTTPASSSIDNKRHTIVDVKACFETIATLSNQWNRKFCGPIVRTPAYVEKWIASEGTVDGKVAALLDTSENKVTMIAFACIREYPVGQYQLRDFGAADLYQQITPSELKKFLLFGLRELCSTSAPAISLPAVFVDYFQLQDSVDPAEEPGAKRVDEGWMWLTLKDPSPSDRLPIQTSEELAATMQCFHPIDYF